MNLSDCEVAHRHVRGHNAIFIFGPRALMPEECAPLAAEYTANYGAMDRPAYCSPAGWQVLHAGTIEPVVVVSEEVAAVVPPIAASSDQVPAESPDAAAVSPPPEEKPASNSDKKARGK